MKRLLRFELKKVIGKRLFWVLFILAFSLNIIMLWWVNRGDTYTPYFSDYRSAYNELRKLDNTEKLQYLQNKKSMMNAVSQKEQLEIDQAVAPDSPDTKSEEKQYETVYQQYKNILGQKLDYRQNERKSKVINEAISGLKTIMNYSGYLDGIRNRASRLTGFSIFGLKQTNSFSARNILKTKNDYASIGKINLRYDIDRGIRLITDFPATNLFLLMILIVICMCMITDEKDKGLFTLVKCTKCGTGRTIAAKLTSMFLLVLLVNTLIFTSSVLFAQATYGLGDLSRPLQSLPDMISSTLKMSVGQYLLLLFVIRTIGLTIIGMMIMAFTILAGQPVLAIIETILIMTVSECFIIFIPASSNFNWLRIFNTVCLVDPNQVIGQYYNLNLFGNPVNCITVFLAFNLFMLLLMIAVNTFVFIRKKEPVRGSCHFNSIISRIKILQPHVHSNFVWYEIKKIAGIDLVAFILILFVLFQWFSVQKESIGLTAGDYYYRHYMIMLSGSITQEKENIIKNEKAKYDTLHAEIKKIDENYKSGKITWDDKIDQENEYDNKLAGEASFLKVYDRYMYIQKHMNTQFVYDLGYEKLFGITDPYNGLGSGIKMMIILALCLCDVFSIEYRTGMFKVLGTTYKGTKHTVWCKLIISAVITVLAFISAYLPDLIMIGRTYGFGGLSAPLSSLPAFEHFTDFSILSYIILLFSTRLIFCLSVSCMILAMSLLIRNSGYTAMTAICIFAGPPLLHIAGIHLFDNISFIPLMISNTYYLCSQNAIVSAIQIICTVVFSILSLFILLKQFCKSDTVKFSACFEKVLQCLAHI